jgi:hypothetical protein
VNRLWGGGVTNSQHSAVDARQYHGDHLMTRPPDATQRNVRGLARQPRVSRMIVHRGWQTRATNSNRLSGKPRQMLSSTRSAVVKN